jgi:hypothetical protein
MSQNSRIWLCWRCSHEWQSSKEEECDWCHADQPQDLGPAYPGREAVEDNVVLLDMETTLDLPVDRVLDAAKEELEGGHFVLAGRTADGELYFAGNFSDKARILYLLEKCKQEIMRD